MITRVFLEDLKAKEQEGMEFHADIVRKCRNRSTHEGCDYTVHHKSMELLFRGRVNLIVDLISEVD